MTRSPAKESLVRGLGASPIVADALDPDSVTQAVASTRPEVIVHELTALSGPMSMKAARNPERFEGAIMTGRLRTEGTDNLLAAGRTVGVKRVVAQSFGAFRFTASGGPAQSEDEPIVPDPSLPTQPGLEAFLYLERAVTSIDWGQGLALRYGGLYGPGTAISSDPDGPFTGPILKRRFPIIGSGAGVTSHIHTWDAAAATVIAVEQGEPGVYNIVDDEPAPVREWLPVLASALGAKPPRHMPRWLARLLAGETATAMMTQAKGSSNAKAKRELGWELRYPSWRKGFREGLDQR
jgi:nucleoside-diphosphate-sugar epimerase